MNRLKAAAVFALVLPLFSSACASYDSYRKAHDQEQRKNWDQAVEKYTEALESDPDNLRYKVALQRAKLEASRVHFERGKALRAGGQNQMAATEFELTVRLDPTNQYAAVEMAKAVTALQDMNRAKDADSIDERKKRAITKAQPPVLNPASTEPISLSFPHETPVKDIYKALGSAFGINILFDQAVKDDRISIELHDVTAQQGLERVFQAAGHFYKVLDSHTIIVVPDNPQQRRDYEDLVIRTFYLSNGDAEQVTNVVRTMIEARNVFPLKALNAITIRDTSDKVLIAEKIIQANDKAKAEVVVDVELVQLDLDKTRNIGISISGLSGSFGTTSTSTDSAGTVITKGLGIGTIHDVRALNSGSFTFTIPQATYQFMKSSGSSQLLANPELRISEGEKATLHIGEQVPVPTTTFTTAVQTGTVGNLPATSFTYRDVGIKVSIEPRVHHNREVTLKLVVEVSNLGTPVVVAGQAPQPTFATRTIESTIRLKDGETNFLAGLIQENEDNSADKTPFLSDLPILGRLFTKDSHHTKRTDLMLTMTPHIVRIPDITEDDLAPMWVGTQNNLSFRGVSPRIESLTEGDPFAPPRTSGADLFNDQPSNQGTVQPNTTMPFSTGPAVTPPAPAPGTLPTDAFQPKPPTNPPTTTTPNGDPVGDASSLTTSSRLKTAATAVSDPGESDMRFSPRVGPQPMTLAVKPGEEHLWTLVGMDLDGLSTDTMILRFDPNSLMITDVSFGQAMAIDIRTPPAVVISRDTGTIKITSSDGKPLRFNSGGDILSMRVRGGTPGESFLVVDQPKFRNQRGEAVASTVTGGRLRVQ
jgi:general secretion pathway protein D